MNINLDLPVYATDPLAGAGLPLWLPDGAVIREELQALAKDLARADGCQSVYSPVLAKRALYELSGHWAKFSDDMFPPMPVGGDELVLRPANCPHHALIYSSAQRSYRDLPVRFNELGAMFRAERSGSLSGLSRVRQINLDDTHVFCRPDQVVEEAARGLRTALRAQEILGLPVDYVRLSRRDDSPSYLWLAPVQVCVMPVSPDQDGAARRVAEDLLLAGLRSRLELNGSLGARVRLSRRRRDCLIAVIGAAEEATGSVKVTDIAAGYTGMLTAADLVRLVKDAYSARLGQVGWPGGGGDS
jgi:threonyl-tRNA synthetase